MRLCIYLVLALPVCDARVRTTGKKLTKLQQDVDFLRYQAIDLRSDIDELFAWRNASESGLPAKADGVMEMDDYMKSVRAIESRTEYIIKGLSDEKMMLREIVSDTTSEFREGMDAMKRMVEEVAAETGKVRAIAERNGDAQLALLVNLTAKMNTELAGIRNELFDCKKQLNESTLAVEHFDKRVNTLTQNMIALEYINMTVNTLSKKIMVVGVLEGKVNTIEQEMVLTEDIDKKVNTLKQEVFATDDELHDKLDQVWFLVEHGPWINHRTSYYKVISANKTYAEATKDCKQIGAYLVEINDATEMEFLGEFVKNDKNERFWIAGTDVDTQGTWRFPDGTLMTYQNWNSGEPNGMDNEDCIHTGGGVATKWNDIGCSYESGYICELKKI